MTAKAEFDNFSIMVSLSEVLTELNLEVEAELVIRVECVILILEMRREMIEVHKLVSAHIPNLWPGMLILQHLETLMPWFLG